MKKKLIYFLNTAILLSIFSCVREEKFIEEQISVHEEPDITVEDAQRYFENDVTEFNQLVFSHPSINTHTHNEECKEGCEHDHSQQITRSLPDLGLTPVWKNGVSYCKDGVSIVEVTVDANIETLADLTEYRKKKNKKRTRTHVSRKLIMAKRNADSPTHMFLITLIPTAECEANKDADPKEFRYLGGSNFSGMVLCSEMDGRYGDIFKYENGNMKQRLQAIPTQVILEKKLNVPRRLGLTLRNKLLTTTRNSGDSEMDPTCAVCQYFGKPCIVHDVHSLDEVVIVGDKPGTWVPPIDWGDNDHDYPTPSGCSSCGSSYCYGSCWYAGGDIGGSIGGSEDDKEEDDCTGPQCETCGGYLASTRSGSNCPLCICEIPLAVRISCWQRWIEVCQTYTISVEILGNTKEINLIQLEMARIDNPNNWYIAETVKAKDVGNLEYFTIERKARTPGVWNAKITLSMNNSKELKNISNKFEIEERYPSRDNFYNNASIRNHLSGHLWNLATTYAKDNPNKVREYGCLIRLNTNTGQYFCGPDIAGNPIEFTQDYEQLSANVIFSYSTTSYDPGDHPVLDVGSCHTHFPLTYVKSKQTRAVGASDFDRNTELPGIGYDYTELINSAHSINLPRDFFSHGYGSRPTP
ncbi:hypothetical protein [Bacteroides sp. 224]|uniref:hypothetical protein n=1 Tax=Bacteroides sp. 224 TaxID=2302936 RepID=UPI0013D1D8B5|nr:hypothetical protein [Bacteroides sp. 224]NDV64573.1 hypothetical protein [Bacteroides sp. 224]